MEPESSLSYSQQPTTDPYPEPDESSPHLPKIHSNILNHVTNELHKSKSKGKSCPVLN